MVNSTEGKCLPTPQSLLPVSLAQQHKAKLGSYLAAIYRETHLGDSITPREHITHKQILLRDLKKLLWSSMEGQIGPHWGVLVFLILAEFYYGFYLCVYCIELSP